MSMHCWFCSLLLAFWFAGSFGQEPSNYTNCGTKRSVLLKALFETDGNLYELDRIFLPARIPTSRYIKVNYTFLNSDNTEEGNCSVTYIWAIGGFLLLQPPKVFQFTSLLFSTPANNLEYLNLKLPFECQELVKENGCTCKGSTSNALDRMTQQVYAANISHVCTYIVFNGGQISALRLHSKRIRSNRLWGRTSLFNLLDDRKIHTS